MRCQIEKYEVLVCASQLRWGLPPQDAIGTLVPGTVILGRQQHGGQELNRTKSLVGLGHELGRAKTGNSSWSRETRERESTSFFETTLHVDDIPRFMPPSQVQEEQLRRVAYVLTAPYH